jgi:endonuclease YncB( thermonuclease family)
VTARAFPATISSVYDGDSFTALADLGFSVWRYVNVRLNGCNAIELRNPGGHEAKQHVLELMPIGTAVTLTVTGWDKFGDRSDSFIALPDGRDLTATMIADGYAAAWDGKGPKPTPPWPIPVSTSSGGN